MGDDVELFFKYEESPVVKILRALCGESLMKKVSTSTIVTTLLLVISNNAGASVFYDWVCDAANCGGDTAFTSRLEISDSAYAAGDFTGVAGNILSWTTTSGVGTGYTLTLPNMLDAGGFEADQTNVRMVLSGDKSVVSELLDISPGTNITFFDFSIGRVDFFEGANYSVGSLQDATMIPNLEFSPIQIAGQFVRVSEIPVPAAVWLFGTALLGFVGFSRRRKIS